ncbi:MAG TPA: gluconokinase, partial [Parafilimonas sp.]|nr:gluconokinase [Parafilimonas sp.]
FCKEENVACVSFSSAMHSFLAVDKNGLPLMNMITWADLRSAKYAHKLEQKPITKKLYETTGVPVHAMSPLCKLIWMKHESKKIFDKAFKFISIKEYIVFKLFEKYIVDCSIAAATGLFDEKNICWYDEALNIAGITEEKLSELVSIEHCETELLPAIKTKLKTKNKIHFVLGASDGALANLGSGLFDAKNMAVTIGTSGAARITTNKYVTDKQQRLFCYYIDKEMYILGGAVNNGGVALQWLIEKILQQNFKDEKVFKKIFKESTQVKTGANGLIFLPYLNGERSPMWDENAKGALIGLTSSHTQANIIKAVLEGICFALLDVINAVEETSGSIEKIYLSGGIIKSKEWVQLFANITGKNIVINDAADASALGAAFVGMKAVGLLNDFIKSNLFLKEIEQFKPDKKQNAVYKKYFSIYNELYDKLKDSFEKISAIKM